MNESRSFDLPAALLLAAGVDRFGEQRGLGISTITFKLTTPNPGDLFILENTFLAKGVPHVTCIMTRKNGSISSKASSSSRWERKLSTSNRVIHC